METTTRVDYENAMQEGYSRCLAAYGDGERVSVNPYPWRSGFYIGWCKALVVIAEREKFDEIKWYRSA